MKWLLFAIGVFLVLASAIILFTMVFTGAVSGQSTASDGPVRVAIFLPLGILCFWGYGRMKKSESP